MDNNLINLDDLQNALSELGEVKFSEEMMTEEMKASQRRCEDYIEKHIEKNQAFSLVFLFVFIVRLST